VSRDPIEESGGLNLYLIAQNNTICMWDYLGFSTVTIISDNTVCGDVFMWQFSLGSGDIYKDVSSLDAAIDNIVKTANESGEKIDKINLSGHGIGGGAGSGNIDFSTLTEAQKNKLKAVLHEDAVLILWVCGSATGEEDRERLQEVSDGLKVCVWGKDGSCAVGSDGGIFLASLDESIRWWVKQALDGADTGGWKEFKPSKTETKCTKSVEVTLTGHKKEKRILK
jgi:hypothetical protein